MISLPWGKKSESSVEGSVKVVLDLDRLLPKPIGLSLHGKTHQVHPVSVGAFAEIYDAVAKIDELNKAKRLKGKPLYKRYAQALAPIVPTITADDISGMSSQQMNAFFLFVFKTMSGEIFKDVEEDSKKKH